MHLPMGICKRRQAGAHGYMFRYPGTGSTASCELPNVDAKNPTEVLRTGNKCSNYWVTSHANNTSLLVIFSISIQSDEFHLGIYICTVLAPLLLTSFLPPNLCPLLAEVPPISFPSAFILHVFYYPLFVFPPLAHLLRSLFSTF